MDRESDSGFPKNYNWELRHELDVVMRENALLKQGWQEKLARTAALQQDLLDMQEEMGVVGDNEKVAVATALDSRSLKLQGNLSRMQARRMQLQEEERQLKAQLEQQQLVGGGGGGRGKKTDSSTGAGTAEKEESPLMKEWRQAQHEGIVETKKLLQARNEQCRLANETIRWHKLLVQETGGKEPPIPLLPPAAAELLEEGDGGNNESSAPPGRKAWRGRAEEIARLQRKKKQLAQKVQQAMATDESPIFNNNNNNNSSSSSSSSSRNNNSNNIRIDLDQDDNFDMAESPGSSPINGNRRSGKGREPIENQNNTNHSSSSSSRRVLVDAVSKGSARVGSTEQKVEVLQVAQEELLRKQAEAKRDGRAASARVSILEGQLEQLKGQMAVLLEKSDHDDAFVDSMQRQKEGLQQTGLTTVRLLTQLKGLEEEVSKGDDLLCQQQQTKTELWEVANQLRAEKAEVVGRQKHEWSLMKLAYECKLLQLQADCYRSLKARQSERKGMRDAQLNACSAEVTTLTKKIALLQKKLPSSSSSAGLPAAISARQKKADQHAEQLFLLQHHQQAEQLVWEGMLAAATHDNAALQQLLSSIGKHQTDGISELQDALMVMAK